MTYEINGYTTPEDEDAALPDDVKAFAEANNIDGKYQCILKQKPPHGGADVVMRSYNDRFPSLDQVGEEFGPGEYTWTFSWRVQDITDGKKRSTMKNFKVVLGESYREAHDRFQEKKAAEEQKRLVKTVERNRILHPAGEAPSLDSLLETLAKLQKATGGGAGGSMDAVLKIMADNQAAANARMERLLEAMATRRSGPDLMTIATALATMGPLLQPLIARFLAPPPQPTDADDKAMERVLKLVDFKKALEPAPQESIADKVFDMLQGLGPAVLAMLESRPGRMMARAQIQGRPEFKALAGDPDELVKLVLKLDSAFGPENTDKVLDVAGWTRPEQCQVDTDAGEDDAGEDEDASDGIEG